MDRDTLPAASAKSIMEQFGYPKLTSLQNAAFSQLGYKTGAREFIMGETSSGKTLIPMVAYQADDNPDKKLLYLVPYRALATQKKADFESLFGEGAQILVSTAEYSASDEAVLRAECDIAVVIYEKVFFMLTRRDKQFFKKFRYIVFDEPGIINSDTDRGLKADFLFRAACNTEQSNVYVLGTPYFNWDKYISRYHFHSIKETSREIRLDEHEVPYTNEDEDMPAVSEIVKICKQHRKKNRKILIFVNSREKCREIAHDLYKSLLKQKIISAPSDLAQKKKSLIRRLGLSEKDLFGFMNAKGDLDFLAYFSGIGFHNASIPEELRKMVEDDFLRDDGGLNIVVSTETLAYGLNSNIDVVVIADLYKRIQREKQMLTVNEYQNYR